MQTVEKHPFEPFIPSNIKFLLIGSFPGKAHTQNECDEEAWYYGSKRNQLWKILEKIHDMELRTKQSKQDLFYSISLGVTDIVKSCIRRDDSNLDSNLVDFEYSAQAISEILSSNQCTIIVTSRFVERAFKKLLPNYSDIIVLPSPSPRYARISFAKKVEAYKELLPKMILKAESLT